MTAPTAQEPTPQDRRLLSTRTVGWAAGYLLISAVLGFVRLGDLPLDARTFIIAGLATVFWISFFVWYSLPSTRLVTRKELALGVCVTLAIAIAALSLLQLVTVYHTVRWVRISEADGVGNLELRSPRFPVTLRLDFFSPGQVVTIDEFEPGPLRPGAVLPQIDDVWSTELQKSIRISDFRHPQGVRIAYRVAGDAELMQFNISETAPPTVRALGPGDLARARQLFMDSLARFFWLVWGRSGSGTSAA